MFSHVTVGTRGPERAGRFYDALLAPLGLRQRDVNPDDGPLALCWVSGDAPLPRFYVYSPHDGRPATVSNGSIAAFLAPTTEAVNASWTSGLANIGTDEGVPGARTHYGEGYCDAYLRDPDVNKTHIVYRGDLDPRGERRLLGETVR
ncbi:MULTISPECIES: VOC family protein [Rhizobium]|uniref:VOC family protein n=1 Tax=Rhizobium rhododendri TaxID=2506430 RepID=A0ABY8ISC6_9HYPH|nr:MULTISPECIES: VOC family protein [Rhizobium]TQX85154.1 VOC family protein [Rhizobium sp. rho-13.1]TQY09442.1 VOC family protein [Rhizobium sp. rho-1.1]WFS25925.1 VOC family protein [Rhizobium rhododendri]